VRLGYDVFVDLLDYQDSILLKAFLACMKNI
jgi:hypothetical protein